MQSYYGSSLAAKRFEVTPGERELQLPEGIVRAWNDQILRRGRSTAGTVLSPGRPREVCPHSLLLNFLERLRMLRIHSRARHFQSPALTVRVREREIELLRLRYGIFPYLPRSEEHTSELQSPCNLVCRLLLEKKKTIVSPRE